MLLKSESYNMFRSALLFITVFIRGSTSYNGTELHSGTELHNYLFRNYKPEVRPCKDYDKRLDVEIRLSLIKILSVDEITQTFKTTVTIIVVWRDDLLVWEPSRHSGINHLVVPYASVWTPDIIAINAAETPGDIGQKYALIKVHSDGLMKIWTQVNLKTQCNIATKRYPFDVQTCSIDFCTFMHDDRDINLRQNINKTALQYYEKTAEWNIIGNFVSVEKDIASDEGLGNYTILKYNFKLQRQCLSCIINVILPVVLLGCLSLLTFFVPSDSGEKMSFPVSIFLTLAVFMTVITLSLPESVDGLSYLGMYVTFELGTGVITLACSVIALRVYQREEVEKKHYYHILLVKIFRPKYQKNQRYMTSVPNGRSIKKTSQTYKMQEIENSSYGGENLRNSRKYRIQESDDDHNDVNCANNSEAGHFDVMTEPPEAAIMWTHVSKAFDICVFTLMVILQVLALFSFLCLILS